MSKDITRRDFLQNVGIAGATSALALHVANAQPQEGQPHGAAQEPETRPSSNRTPAALQKADLAELTIGNMVVAFDRRYGSIYSIKRKGDPFQTNFIGNQQNTPGVDLSNTRWTGDLVSSVWNVTDRNPNHLRWNPKSEFVLDGNWKQELTGRSGDIRRVSFDGETFSVNYDGISKDENGIRSFSLASRFHAGNGDSLLWDIEIRNTTGKILEIGELGFPLTVNDDQGEYYRDPKTGQPFPADDTEHPLRIPSDYFSVYREQYPRIQKLYHEKKVIAHHYIGGHSSYVLIERPLGDAPFLLLHSTDNAAFECVYRDLSSFAEHAYYWDGPNILAVHSWATSNVRNWYKNPWINGHTSLVLQSGETWSCQLRFAFIPSYEAIREEIYKAGNLGIRVLPAMVMQENANAYLELMSHSEVDRIDFLSDNITVKEKRRVEDKTLLILSFQGRGQKSLKFHYAGRWTNVHFYCIEDIAKLLTVRGEFIVSRQFYENPDDPYHRNHMFLPFDHRIGSTFRDADEVSEVGGSDAEFGVSEPLFLAEKNIYYPSPREIAIMETYIEDCLFKYIQNPETYAIRASLYWKLRYPSSPWSHWTEERSKDTYRSYNYAHFANIYHAMYQIGKRYGLLTRRTPQQYLMMAYHTSLAMFRTDPWGHIGVMGGSNSLNIMKDLGKEGFTTERNELLDEIRKCNSVFVQDPYPYTSEYPVDTTAQEQVYFFTEYFGDTEKSRKTLQIIKALRGGNQPVWFQYGNDNKGDLTCWYTESTNGWALLRGFEQTGDTDMLVKGFAGVMSVEVDMLTDGMCFAHFISTPGIFDFTPPRTLDGGVAQFGFLKAIKSYVIDDESFGLVGFGSHLELVSTSSQQQVRVYPADGVRKRFYFAPKRLDFDVIRGEIECVTFSEPGGRIGLNISDSTGIVTQAEFGICGLPSGDYRIRSGGVERLVKVSDSLQLSLAIADARLIEIEKV